MVNDQLRGHHAQLHQGDEEHEDGLGGERGKPTKTNNELKNKQQQQQQQQPQQQPQQQQQKKERERVSYQIVFLRLLLQLLSDVFVSKNWVSHDGLHFNILCLSNHHLGALESGNGLSPKLIINKKKKN